MTLQLTSSGFSEGATIPAKYTCDGEDASPPLRWARLPVGTHSLALIADDPAASLAGAHSVAPSSPAATTTVWFCSVARS